MEEAKSGYDQSNVSSFNNCNSVFSVSSQVLSQRFSQSVGLGSHGDQSEETSVTRGAEMATNTITVLSKYGYYGYKLSRSNFSFQCHYIVKRCLPVLFYFQFSSL